MFVEEDKFLILNNNPAGLIQFVKASIAIYLYKYNRISRQEAIEFAGLTSESFWNKIETEVIPHVSENMHDMNERFLELLKEYGNE